MKILKNITVYAGRDTSNTKKSEEREPQNSKSLYAGNLNNDIFANNIQQKKKEAQEKAMKVIADVWDGDRAIDEDLQARAEHVKALRQENKEAQSRINDINKTQNDLMEQYGVTEDSKEQQDLEILRGKRDFYCNTGKMNQEEFLQYAKTERAGLTEYQHRQLELDAEKEYYKEIIDENERTIFEENAIISGTKLERLKHSAMTKAQRQADGILDAASKEIIGMVMEEAKEHVDEEQEQREEKAEEIKEKREEQEAFIEKQRDKREEQESHLKDVPMEEMLDLNQNKIDVQKEVQNIINEMKLVAEDIKGAVVDESL